jgi:hypothetical protein
MKRRRARRVEHPASGAQAAIGRAAIGAAALGGSGGGCDGGWRNRDRRFSDPGSRREARQDPAPRHRGARGRTVAREGAGRRAGANFTVRRLSATLVNSVLYWSAQPKQKEGAV